MNAESPQGVVFDIKNASNVTVEANGAHSAVQTANNTVFKVSGASALDFIGNSGVQCAYFDISGKSVVNADIGNASVAGYFNMNDANVNVENINIYGAKLVASDINATGFVGVYAKQSTTSNIAGQTAAINASEITLFTDSEIVSPELYNGLYNAVSGTSTANGTAAKFTDGTVEFQNINADSKAATGWTFNGTTVRGATTVEAAKDANVTITGGDNGLILGENASLTLVEGNKFVGKIGYIADDGKAKLTTVSENGLVAGTDGLTFSEGSVVLSGTINATTAVTITANGDVEIDGATITGTTTTAGGLTVTIDNGAGNSVSVVGKLTVAEGGSLTVTQGSKLTVDPKATLAVGGTVSGAIDNKGTIALISQKANVADADVTGTGTVDSSAIASEGTISGSFDTTTTFTKNQVITATGDVTLVKGTVFTFEGTLIIPEGIKFVVEDGAQLIVSGIAGKIENNGAIIIESKSQSSITPTGASEAVDRNGGFVIMGGSEVTNNGTITLDYTLPEVPSTYYSMNIASKFTNNGNVVVGEDSELVISATNAVNGVDGTFSIAGAFSIDALANAGLVTINGEVTKASNISLTSVDAKVDIVSIAGSFLLSVNNTGFNSDEKLNIVNDEAQKINIKAGTGTDASSSKQVIEGISITLKTEKTEDYTQSDEKPLYQQFVVSGKITTSFVDTTVDSEKLGISYVSAYGRAVVSEAVSVGEKITFTVKNDSDLIVRGTFDVVKGGVFNIGAADSNITGSAAGEVTVTGKLTLIAADLDATEKSRINAASYTVASTTETDKKYVYTAFATAVADGAKVINILGENDVDVDVTIPADVSVIFSNTGDMAIDEDAEVSFETGSILKNAGSGIDVDGVLYIADVKGTLKSGADKIVSDVTINGEKDRTYCGLAYALGNAKEGDVVKLSNDLTGDNAISKNLIIPAGVTLDTNGYDVVVEKNVTVTVNGTLFIDNDRENSIITLNPGTSAADKDAKIVANGVVKSDNRSILEMGLDITGAYYVIETNTDDTYYVEPVENAVGKIADAGALSYGADSVNMVVMNYDADAALKVSDITVTGKSADEPAVILFALNDVEIKSITLDNAAAAFADIDVNAVITNSVGTVTVNGNSSIFTVGSTNIDDVKTLVIAGGFEEFADTDDRTYAFTVAGVASLSTCDIDKIVVDGTLNVLADSDADKAVIGTLVVNGTFNVPSDTYASITEAEVYGTFSVAELTTEQNAGTATVDEMYVGISMKDAENDTSGAAGTVTGPVDVTKYVVVAPGSTVPEAITEENSTQFYVEDTLYITVYTVDGNAKIGEFKTKVENADFQYWSKGTENANDKKVGDVGYEKVTAKIVYEVYNVVILADVGVNDVSIDGNLMLANGANSYYAIVAAGKHTITYNLANGYTGEAKLAVNGSVFDGATCTLDGMNFDISGKFNETTNGYDTVVTLQLTGIEKSGFVPDAPDSSDNGGMTITDYLLIILVVLIVVMAIIVAMRLMRS
ncbi:beta strand repeat-containing protein [Candidatus Methanoprimaticola sp. MG2]|uniref:beta strand repeat-containing protein n=1 Tax=Candidatus Methanoprimaticola sp. MG2 TaxID=3228838 RepID=UPI0039C72B02